MLKDFMLPHITHKHNCILKSFRLVCCCCSSIKFDEDHISSSNQKYVNYEFSDDSSAQYEPEKSWNTVDREYPLQLVSVLHVSFCPFCAAEQPPFAMSHTMWHPYE